ncbi:cysteine-rich and transmembrane domain-containing protein 1-like isoform X2 [Siniperca chuatsi]|uniref:cysteine-rich and transmembrane domain-containing protein 1-like isoform X2 n=1 Tax=Siniperca chuatsi TaxID=119488 RepID=UPI001CE15095|nr:cysteine-rich and transmembrane domain-containing protein 1-like isoform X2 [Siniperca chuatsi]
MSDHPPPYLPHPPGGPSAPGFHSAFSSQPAAFPGSPYQTFPQTYTGGGDHSYYQGPSEPPGPPGPYLAQPGYQGYQSGSPGTSHPWDGPKTYGEPPRHTVFVVEQQRGVDDSGAEKSCLAACLAALCCCCLLDMLTGHH